MSIGANSYGSTAGVASIAPRYADGSGDTLAFTTTTRPTILQVEAFIDQVSGMVNAMLAEAGLTIPVTDNDVRNVLDLFVNMEAGLLCDASNGSGRLIPNEFGRGGGFKVLIDDIKAFITANAAGFERLGAARAYSATSGMSYRDVDNAGNDVSPIFQRGNFNNIFDDSDPI